MRLTPLLLLAVGVACGPIRPGQGAVPVAADGTFRVAVFGDMPYHAPNAPDRVASQAAYEAVLDTIGKERVAFVVNIGDITGSTCTDSVYAQRLREFNAMPHPLVYTFGDNEWTDCARDAYDPLERLATLRLMFASGSVSLGARPIPLVRQSEDARFATYRENVRWTMNNVLFLTVHVMGSNNNRGRDTISAPNPEWVGRNAANIAWLRDAFARATASGNAAVAIFMQANPGLATQAGLWVRPRPDGYGEMLRELQRLATAYGKPVALVHGDTHYFRFDQPFTDSSTARVTANMVRAETSGEPNKHALLMTVDPRAPSVFRFEPLLVRLNR